MLLPDKRFFRFETFVVVAVNVGFLLILAWKDEVLVVVKGSVGFAIIF